MKQNIAILLLFSLTSLLITSCSGGGKSTMSSTEISGLNLRAFGGKMNITMNYVDRGDGIDEVIATLYDSQHIIIGSRSATVSENITSESDSPIGLPISGLIRADLNLSDLRPGTYSLDLFLKDKDGRLSNKLTGEITSSGGFQQAKNYPNPQEFTNLGDTAIGDLNGDGRNDVVAIEGANVTGLLMIYYQDSSGALEDPIIMDLNIEPIDVVIADINSDTKEDLLVSGYEARILVFLQDPATGMLQPPSELRLTYSYSGLLVADINSDGKNDIVAPQGGSRGTLSIFFQNDSGGLEPEVQYNDIGVIILDTHIADMNNDGRNDLVVKSGAKAISVIKQTAPGVFSNSVETYEVKTSYWPEFDTFALGDLNDDGLNDVVATGPGNGNYLNIFLQNLQGKLDPPMLVNIVYIPDSIKIADITGDGLNDIIGELDGKVVVYPQGNDSLIGTYSIYYNDSPTSGAATGTLSIGDLTGDGLLDAVTTWTDEGIYFYPYGAQITIRQTGG